MDLTATRPNPKSLNCAGRLVPLDRPVVMGILNLTPDSFYDGGKHNSVDAALRKAEQILAEGATFLDLGGMSTRPGAELIDVKTERKRVLPVVKALQKRFPDALLSIDTVQSEVARAAVEAGAHLINDISAGGIDKNLLPTVAELGVPYVLMHLQGKTPDRMQDRPVYENVTLEVVDFFLDRVGMLRAMGFVDIILDPGFGFGKTVAHNYQLLRELHAFQILDLPLLAGVSRKSMIYRPLGITPAAALNGTTALHMVALQQGAHILRAHDVREAVETIRLFELLNGED